METITIRPSTVKPQKQAKPLASLATINRLGITFSQGAAQLLAIKVGDALLLEQRRDGKLFLRETMKTDDVFKVAGTTKSKGFRAPAPGLYTYLTKKNEGTLTFKIGDFKEGMRELIPLKP